MRTLFALVLGVVGLAIVAVVAVPFVVSTDWMRDQVTAAVHDQTGRELIIAGNTSLSLFPSASLVVENATLLNPEGREGSLVRMDGLDLGLRLVPLLSGRVEVNRFILTRPVINLEINEEGAANWTFAVPGDGDAAGAATPPPPEVATGPSGTLPMIEWLGFGDVRIVGGVVTFEDHRLGSYAEMRDIDATVRLASLDEPLEIDGTMSWQGEPLTFSLDLAEPRALATGTPTGAVVGIESALLQASYQGTLAAKGGIDAEGDIDLSTSSLKDLARWLGNRLPRIDGLGAGSIKGVMKAGPEGISLSSAQVSIDQASAEGGFLVSFAGEKPLVQATLAADRIDVNRYLRPAAPAGGAGSAAKADGKADAPSGPPTHWGGETIDVSSLRTIDADLRLSTRELLFRDLKAGQSALAVTLKDGVLTIDLSELQLYEGRAVGKLTVNGASEIPAIAVSFSVDDVAGLPIMRDAAGLEWLEGRGQLSGTLASRGRSESGLIDALNGDIALRFTDGSIRGFNLAQMMRGLSGGATMSWSREAEQSTDFSELSASFKVAKGIAQTGDISMLGPLVRLSGIGVANLPQRSVDFRVKPKIVASLEGQGGESDLTGREVPLMIKGPWSGPAITPDLEAVIRDPQAAIDTIEQIGRTLDDLRSGGGGDGVDAAIGEVTKKKPRELLDMFLGGGPAAEGSEGQGGGDPQPPPISEDLFNQLLGR